MDTGSRVDVVCYGDSLTFVRSVDNPETGGIKPTQEAVEAAWQSFVELIVEAMEESLTKGRWATGKGLVGVEDTLNETFIRDRKDT